MSTTPYKCLWAPLVFCLLLAASSLAADGLRDDLGRNEVRIYAQRFRVVPGRTVVELALAERLERLGYTRRRGARPTAPGEFFWGHEKFWVFRRPVRIGTRQYPSRLIGLRLRRQDGLILGGIDEREEPLPTRHLWLEPELLAESFETQRAISTPVRFQSLPEHVWRPVLAAEDARFFDHSGMDARSLARAMLANARAGKVVQGGSTITQQLVKLRDMSPKRSLGRKASEAMRALALEAEYDKEEILEAYLNAVYYGHVEGAHLYGLGTAARTFFSKPASELDLAESALLAAMIQGPNRLSPVRNPEAVLIRYRWVLSRMGELRWASASGVASASRRLPRLRLTRPDLPMASHFIDMLQGEAEGRAPNHSENGRGVVVHSTLDPLLQAAAEAAVEDRLERLRSSHRRLRAEELSAALVALDGRTGDILAYVGGDPAERGDAFDRARRARRQPGSTVKPLVLLEAFESCGRRQAIYPARRVSDRPLTLELPSGPWSPENPDRRFRDALSVRDATVASLNVPFVRIARWCGLEATARRIRRAGLDLPEEPAPSFVLGAVETSPLDLARAYTTFSSLGRAWRPRSYEQIFLPAGRLLDAERARSEKVTREATAYLIRDLLEDVLQSGPAASQALAEESAFGKTGTSSESRDAWFVGGAGSVVAAVWVGIDAGGNLGLSGAAAAAPIWKVFMEAAVPLRPAVEMERPQKIVEHWIQPATGLLVSRRRSDAEPELFRRGATPPRRRLWRRDEPLPVIE